MSKWENIPDSEKKKLEVSFKQFIVNKRRKDKIKKLLYDKRTEK